MQPTIDLGPIVTLPPDLVDEHESFAMAPRLWHWSDIAERVGAVATGKKVKIAVGDTGYMKHVNGPIPIAQKSFIANEGVTDRNSHGTHVIGSALGRNGIGIAPEADLIVFKCLSDRGSGSSAGIAAGIRWAVDQGADIISLSLGGGSSYRPTNEAIDYAWSKGCIVNSAAGNMGYNGANTIGWPAKYKGSLCCGAYQQNGTIASFSSGGGELDWACPGQQIISFANNGSGFSTKSGTSMATPIGSGTLGLIVEIMRRQGSAQWTAADAVRAWFKVNLTDRGAPGWDPRFGSGIPVYETILQRIIRSDLQWS